ncbi:hypothetical protein Amir_1100 [Actinosynnema mirum DSM 43827]|uniref:Uncharacterized protein n=1 Tax=Actinosynnema mirum (strain ATCC 29888 / DSM 43827 / JCM 3225 / NBRC 14064 / NCIMB 13271 / NRRL B-12336 / IMRU 3971 / 101) TaxID=446462 RepID=C6WQ00_ACTMD|nr:hypothetical protein Amir_1100 [Actinosynnema mirum DSM 43827]
MDYSAVDFRNAQAEQSVEVTHQTLQAGRPG